MRREMAKIISCNAEKCSYNREILCNALAINVGGSGAICNAFVNTEVKCIGNEMESSVTACKMQDCKFNDCLICNAPAIDIRINGNQAICNRFSVS